ncbi:hypothetical protein OCU04_004100 [Sclerotinia nivalis]|uniref:C2H2-type domain-containing protein n=1 Tax=Sclerotinia nivalis TaxID=352851 RepID=A0A9X0DM41_9HELO|nr:hypothetical protein OCU04_004100 [Sclerotinia nivalis]
MGKVSMGKVFSPGPFSGSFTTSLPSKVASSSSSMASELAYNVTHQVLICTRCQTCIIPGARSIERHLRNQPHHLSGDVLKAQLTYTNTLTLKTKEELREQKPPNGTPQLEHLKAFRGFECSLCHAFLTIHLPRMRHHMSTHSRKANEHKTAPLWQECLLQTYFTAGGHIDYFRVVEDAAANNNGGGDEVPLTQPEKDSFNKIERNLLDIKKDLYKEAGVVRDIKESRAERVPWLHDVTKFPFHLAHLKDEEIWDSYKLPSKKELDGDCTEAEDPRLVRILNAAEAMMRDAYQLCSDASPDRKMTQQRANILNEFYAGASGKADGFRYHKNASTLVKYFLIGKQLLVYYYRVVYLEDGFFTTTQPDQKLPRDIIEPTSAQIRIMDEIMEALNIEDPDESELALKHTIRRLYLALICHSIGSVAFKSPVLSFCAMKSRMIYGHGL